MHDDTAGLPRAPVDALSARDRQDLSLRFDLDGPVYSGGMGSVFGARHRALGTRVALKVLRDQAHVERFEREAKTLASVDSPYVVTVHDFIRLPSGSPCLVMDWVEGPDLQRELVRRGGPIDEPTALRWMQQTALGMTAAEDRNIVHRDLKPANILLDAKGVARVTDFGLALSDALEAGGRLTSSGIIIGSPYYMSPEQADDPHAATTRSDIYGYGATFYHVLTGSPPFEGTSFLDVLLKHRSEPLTPPGARKADLSANTNELIERCLAKSPNDRFQSFRDIEVQLHGQHDDESPWADRLPVQMLPMMAAFRSRREAYLAGDMTNGQVDVYELPNERVIKVVCGDLADQEVDALVTSDMSNLGMYGSASRQIVSRGGGSIRAMANQFAPARPGRVVVTPAGELPARLILHGVLLGHVDGKIVAPSRDLILEVIRNCFYHAESFGLGSLAMPLIGSGGLGFPADIVLDTAFTAFARTLWRGLTPVLEARIVLYPRPQA